MLRSVRFLAFSLVSLGLAACVKLSPATNVAVRPEPRIAEQAAAVEITEGDRIEALQDQVAALDAELAALRKALAVMSPLPEAGDLFITISAEEITGDIPKTDPETEAAARLARLYALPPSFIQARSLFYKAELGAFESRDAADPGCKRLSREKSIAGLNARYTSEGAEVRLAAGPLASEVAVKALCVELSPLAGQCRVAAPIRAY